MNHPRVAGNVELAIDATGVGRPVADMFVHAGIRFTGVVVTSGHEETNPGGSYRHVPKITLISHVQALLHEGKLKIRKDMPEAANLVRELQDFRVNYSATGFMSFSAREGKHDDLVLALSIAIWCARRTKTGQESWAEFLERGDWGGATDYDDVRAAGPEFNWEMAGEPLLRVVVPEPIASEGSLNIRHIEGRAVAEMTRGEARRWLRNPVWRSLNPELAAEMFNEEKA
jgi:hypothetical protein